MKLTKSKLRQIIKEEVKSFKGPHKTKQGPIDEASRSGRYEGPELEGAALARAKELFDQYKPRKGSAQDREPHGSRNRYSAWQRAQHDAAAEDLVPELTAETLEGELAGFENVMAKLQVAYERSVQTVRDAIQAGDLDRGKEILEGLKKGASAMGSASWYMNPHSAGEWAKKE